MDSPGQNTNALTPSQRQAVDARGNVLVMAGAGTGKTKTLVARCLHCLAQERASLDSLLVITFTEAAAAELRQRLRVELEKQSVAAPDDEHWPRQLALFDLASIGTLHGFCLRLVREHFHELRLDPQLAMLDEGEARQLAADTLAAQFQAHYAGDDAFSRAVQNLIAVHGHGHDEKIRALILRLHHYSQTRPDAAGWLAAQAQKFSAAESTDWPQWLLRGIQDWRDEWLPVLENLQRENPKAAELLAIFHRLKKNSTRADAAAMLDQIVSLGAKENFPRGTIKTQRKPLESLFDEAAFLQSLAVISGDTDPLVEDWTWIRGHMETLVRLAQEFEQQFAARKRSDGVLDFHDLEQFALKLLWDFSTGQPTAIARLKRDKLSFVFVDEYQDINAAQDRIIAALSRDDDRANRFLVGDVKQSIYRFRLADPAIFRNYARMWRPPLGQTIPLSANFRSHPNLLDFVNSVFSLVLREEVGGVAYDRDAQLHSGLPPLPAETPGPRVDLLLRLKPKAAEIPTDVPDELADLEDSAHEARLVAAEVKKLVAAHHPVRERDQLRPAQYRDFAVLLRSPRSKSDVYAREFERLGIPLTVARGGFFQSAEILDLLSLLRLLDNPLQDVPCIAVLRSPLVGLSLDELAQVRLAAPGKPFWTALVRCRETSDAATPLAEKISRFLDRFSRWRQLARQASLSECLEAVLAETLYADWLRTRPRGPQRVANLERFLALAAQFDQFQRQGLFRFLKFIEAQEETGSEPDVPAVAQENAVRLMSIHQSKGLEFPVVILPALTKAFNEQDLRSEIIFDEEFGLCPRVKPPSSGRHYPSLPHWLAHRRQKRELLGEELRLLYVAFTRARDTLLLVATVTETKWKSAWTTPASATPHKLAAARSFADWLALWFAQTVPTANATNGETPLLRWRLSSDAASVTAPATALPVASAANDLTALDAPTAARLRAVLDWQYPRQAATQRKAKSSVTELRRAAEELDDEAQPLFPPPSRGPRRSPAKMSAADTGIAHHKFLQHVALAQTTDVTAEAARLVRENFLSPAEHAALDLPALAAFWDSDLGAKIRSHAAAVQRELPFTARFAPTAIAAIIGGSAPDTLADEFIVVQGVADLVVLLEKEIWLVDFKTDQVRPKDLPTKIELYRPQVQLYAAALENIYAPRRVTLRALHFLSAHKTVDL